jgi:hypothetical protein
MSVAGTARAGGRYVTGLRRFLREPLDPAGASARIEAALARREQSFLRLLERGVYGFPAGPYCRLLSHLGIEYGDVEALVRDRGLEGALERLYSAGVYLRNEEMKGRRPIERAGLEIAVSDQDFSNPLLVREFETGSGGSRGAGRRIAVDFDHFAHEANQTALFMEAFGLEGSPVAIWGPVPPGHAAINNVLRHAKLGRAPERWFSPYRWGLRASSLKFWAFTAYAVWGSRLWRRPLPRPTYAPLADAAVVAEWLASKRKAGTPALLETNCSAAVRASLAALERGLDISGTLMRVGGEPFTEAKAAVLAEAGVRAACHYSIGEVGRVGIACARPAALDDCHLLIDKLAVIRRSRQVPGAREPVPALHLTTLHPAAPKLLLNAETDDYAVLERRDCGCAIGAVGLGWHLHSIRSYEKLSSEGMNFLGIDLLRLLEEELPARLGGRPTDYQLVEYEDAALPVVEMVIAPRVGPVDEERAVEAVLSFLASRGDGEQMMADRWRQAGTVRVARREPAGTRAGKVLPLQIERPVEEETK